MANYDTGAMHCGSFFIRVALWAHFFTFTTPLFYHVYPFIHHNSILSTMIALLHGMIALLFTKIDGLFMFTKIAAWSQLFTRNLLFIYQDWSFIDPKHFFIHRMDRLLTGCIIYLPELIIYLPGSIIYWPDLFFIPGFIN